jgi:hypothetical protein
MRLATVYFDRLEDAWRQWTLGADPVEVRAIGSEDVDGQVQLLVGAEIRLEHRPKITGEGGVVIPHEPRRQAEAGIEYAADLIAVIHGTRRSIASPQPPVALQADGDDGRNWLEGARFVDFSGERKGSPSATWTIELTDEVQSGLRDRLNGVALLAEALAQSHPTGQFHEFIRLFERAFARPAKLVARPLAQLLDPKLGYTEDETKYWMETLRDPATHADARSSFVLESDTRPVIGRMRQAAFDVLLNKQNWQSPDAERRALWSASTGTPSDSSDLLLTQGQAASIQFQLTGPTGDRGGDDLGGVCPSRGCASLSKAEARPRPRRASVLEEAQTAV